MTQQEKFVHLTTAPIPKLMLELSAPTIFSMLITAFYNMADTFFVGKINTSATAAVGVVFSLMAIIQAIGFFFGHGSGNYIARKLGEKDFESAKTMASTGFFLCLIICSCLAITGLFYIKPLAYFLGSTDTIYPYAKDYMKYILIGFPITASSFVLNNQLRYQGNAFYGMIGIVTGGLINIALDPLFIFGFKMGVSGAALATVLSQAISFSILLTMTYKNSSLKISKKNFVVNSHYLIEIFKGGFPSLCRQALASIGTIVLNFSAGPFGDSAIAGMSIVNRIIMFANSAMIGFGQGFQPICGFNYGAKLYSRVKEAFWFCVKYSFAFLVVTSIIMIIFAPQFIHLFRDDAEVIAVGAPALIFQAITFPFNSWIVMSNMMLQSAGRAASASILASARQGLTLIPLVLILSHFFGITGIQLAQPIGDVITVFIAIPFTFSFLNSIKEK